MLKKKRSRNDDTYPAETPERYFDGNASESQSHSRIDLTRR
jgi:hypothetical protein